MAEVVLERVGKTYPNGVRAVHDVSLTIADGELVVLVGPSGCGKTTTLRMIAGLETPTSGTIRINGRVVNAEPPHRRDVAMVFQRPALYPHLNVRDNLGFALSLRQPGLWTRRLAALFSPGARLALRTWNTERRERISRTAQLLELSELLDRRPSELSGGQQQRAALGRALVREPAVFLLDEPLSNLDARLRMEMRRELHLLHRRLRATMVYVTHDQDEALSLGDRVVLLDRGEVQQVDRPQALYDRPVNRAAAAFIGWPPMNFLEGRLVQEQDRLFLAAGDGRLPLAGREEEWQALAGREVALGIRPEYVRVEVAAGSDSWRAGGVSPLIQPTLADHAPNQGAYAPRSPAWALEIVEKAGPFRLATLRYGGWMVTARLDGSAPVSEGTPAVVELSLVQAHLFDRQTGRVLSSGRSEG